MSNIFVFDTNCLVSATLLKKSINVQAIDKAILTGKIAISQYTMFEFTEVIFRQKFDRYFVDDSERLGLIAK